MDLEFEYMNENAANDICYKWKYPGEYSFYDMTEDLDDLNSFIDPRNWHRYFCVKDEHETIGFVMYVTVGIYIYIGIGMKPYFTGKGLGRQFITDSLTFLKSRPVMKDKIFRLKVASFNKRAIKLFENTGFKKIRSFMQNTNGGRYPFIEMELPSN